MESLGLVAVYGSLRAGMGNHRVLGASTKVGSCKVQGWVMRSLGGFPYIHHGEGEIVIEVYEVNALTSARLDGLEGYPSFYNREQIDTPFGKAWIYFIEDRSHTAPLVTSGDWVQYRQERLAS